jgi:hypothetical protein
MTKGTVAKSNMTKLFFPIYDRKFPWIFPIFDENLRPRGKIFLDFL